jgi:hypothetical protein
MMPRLKTHLGRIQVPLVAAIAKAMAAIPTRRPRIRTRMQCPVIPMLLGVRPERPRIIPTMKKAWEAA